MGGKSLILRPVLGQKISGIGLVFQDYALFPHMSILDNVLFALNTKRSQHLSTQEKNDRAIDALEKSHLLDAI
jgi:multiple sugar transport system ATP-binding protein